MEQENLTSYVSNLKLTSSILFKTFDEIFIKESNITILNKIKSTKEKGLTYKISFDNKEYILHIRAMNNITNSGWSDKPQIRRIQVDRKYLDDLVDTKENELTIICGLVQFKNEPIFCFWNPKRYITHKTRCSCYVNVSSINTAFKEGYYFGHDSGKEIYACNSHNLQRVIIEFIKNNYISGFDW